MNDITAATPSVPDGVFDPSMPLSLAVLFNEGLFNRVQAAAERMANAKGATPKHLIDKASACFFVIQTAISWRLDPMYVARNTYETPGGQIGYQGALVNAIAEQSGRLEPGAGGIKFEFTGDWTAIDAKPHEERDSKKLDDEGRPKKYAARAWSRDDAMKGKPGVTMRARLRGERTDREFSMFLYQAFPLNSTLWASDPRTQLVYLATRRFVNLCMPSVLGGFVDPLRESQSEVDMGAADVVHEQEQERELSPAHSENAAAQAGTAANSAPDETGDKAEGFDAPKLITESALRIVNAKLSDPQLREAFLQHWKLADPSELTAEQVNGALDWIKHQKLATGA